MDVVSGRRRSSSSVGGGKSSGGGVGVVAGSVWETRMKNDEVKGGIKVFNGEDNGDENNGGSEVNGGGKKVVVRRGQSGNLVAVSGKRKTWKGETFNGEGGGFDNNKNSIQVAKKSPVQVLKKGRSEDHVGEKSPVPTRKSGGGGVTRSDSSQVVKDKDVVVDHHVLRRSKSEAVNKPEKSSLVQLRKAKSESNKDNLDGPSSLDGGCENEEEKNIGSEETCKEVRVCQERVIPSDTITTNGDDVVKSQQEVPVPDSIPTIDLDDHHQVDEAEVPVPVPIPTIDLDDHHQVDEAEVPVPIPIPTIDLYDDHQIDEAEEEEEEGRDVDEDQEAEEEEEFEEVEVEEVIEKKNSIDIKEINVQEQKPKRVLVFNETKKQFNQLNNKTTPTTFTSTLNKQPPPVTKRASIYSNFTKPTTSSVPDYQNFPETHNNKLQNLVDLVMWRDVSKSAFVFGIGTFVIISSSYTQDLNFSFISVTSYLGLVYLAAIFLYRAIICRGVIDVNDTRYVVGEEEAVWILKLILPYLNEFLLKLKALFSGDPATTMKLAVLLFVLARCGTSITIWKMTKLGFFGVFTIPKVCCSYSAQLTAYGKFWIRRFRDAWDSCSHKKAVAFAIFTLVWNLSSIVARIWAAFMLFVALRYYQQKMVTDDWVEDRTVESEDTWQEPIGGKKERQRPIIGQVNKAKKGF